MTFTATKRDPARDGPIKTGSLLPRLALLGLMLLFLALGLGKSMLVELSQGPDEVTHFTFTRFVAQHRRLPLTDEEQSAAGYKADVPPLFYLISGLAGSFIELDAPPFVKLTRDNPRLQLVFGIKNMKAWRALNTEDPLRGEILLWYLARWISLLFGLLGLLGLYLLIRATQPDDPWLAVSGTALLAFLPTYLFISSVISYESLTGALLAFYFLALFHFIQKPVNSWLTFAAALCLGLAAASRFTPLPALPVLLLIVLGVAYYRHFSWQTTLKQLLVATAGILLSFGAWIFYTLFYFNRIEQRGWFYGLLSTFLVSDGSDTASLEIAGLLSGGQLGQAGDLAGDSLLLWLWGLFSGIWGRGWLGWIFLALYLLALAGLAWSWRKKDSATRLWITILALHLGLFLIFPLLRFFISGISSGRTQHILFSMGGALIVLLIYGLRSWLSSARLSTLLFIIAAIFFGRAVQGLAQAEWPWWPVQTVALAAGEIPIASFEALTLLDYDYQAGDQMLDLTLQWRADALPAEDYVIELTLLDSAGQPQARWQGQPLNARYPTRAWAIGDRVRDTITLPISNFPPGEYEVQLRLLHNDQPVLPQPMSTAAAGATTASDHLRLRPVLLNPESGPLTNTIAFSGRTLDFSLYPSPVTPQPFYEYATIILLTAEPLGETISVGLVGADDVIHPPSSQVGRYTLFNVAPAFANGDYRLRFEQLVAGNVIDRTETEPLLQIETQERQFALAAPIAQPLAANFAGYVALIGADLPQRKVQQGQALPLTLHWQALRNIGADLVMFNHLIAADQQLAASRDRRAREVYSTMLWVPDEVVSDPFALPVDASAPDGIYQLLVGLYLPVGDAPVALPLLQDGAMGDVTHVALGPIKVGNTPPGYTVETATPQVELNQAFGDGPELTLLGFSLHHEQDFRLTLYWRAEAPLSLDYTTFVHLRNAAGETVAQQDQPPLGGAYPTGLWDPGEIIADEIALAVPVDLSTGVYRLVVGMYDFNSGLRLTVPGAPANEVVLTDVSIQ